MRHIWLALVRLRELIQVGNFHLFLFLLSIPPLIVLAHAGVGILDAAGLLEAFSKYPGKDNIDHAIRAYEPGGLQRAKDLYLRSKEVSRPLVYRPGRVVDPPLTSHY